MKAFHFTLEPVLESRITAENERTERLASCKRDEEAAARRLEELHQGYRECLSRLGQEAGGVVDLANRRSSSAYLHELRGVISDQKRALAELRERVEEARRDLVAASQERQIIEKLKDKRYREYRMRRELEERRLMDELAARPDTHARRLL